MAADLQWSVSLIFFTQKPARIQVRDSIAKSLEQFKTDMPTETDIQPNVEFLARILQTASRLVCSFGWSDESTREFLSRNFECLVLKGGKQAFHLPNLGSKASALKELVLASSGIVEGLEQFKNIEKITVAWLPRNGLDLSIFPQLKELSFEKEKRLENQLAEQENLEILSIEKYSGADCSKFSEVRNLRSLWLTQGGIRSLSGLELCSQLESIELAYLRNLSNINALMHLKKMHIISLKNLPKAHGEIEIGNYPDLEFFYVSECKQLNVSLLGLRKLKRLKKLWLNTPSTGLNWLDIFSLPEIEMVMIHADEKMPDDDALRSLAEQNGKRLTKIVHTGPRHKRGIQLYFSL